MDNIPQLGSRYFDDDKPIFKNFTPIQKKYKSQIKSKIKSGEYKFEEINCPVCKKSNFDSLAAKDRYGLYFPVGVCISCGLVQTTYRMDELSYNKFYNNEYRRLYESSEIPLDSYFIKQYNKGRLIYEYLLKHNVSFQDLSDPQEHNEKSVLEIGCSMGGILKYFKDKGWNARGVDLGDEYISYGKDKLGVSISTGTIHDIKIDAIPDLIIINHVFEHLLDPNKDLKKLHSLVGENTIIYVSVPGVMKMTKKKEVDFLRYLQNAHIYYFGLKSLTNLFQINSFKLIYGDEGIRAIFKKNKNIAESPIIQSCYDETKSALLSHESIYLKYSSFPWIITTLPKVFFVEIRTRYRKISSFILSKTNKL